MKNYMPSDITSNALRDAYYKTQKLIAEKYEEALKMTNDKSTARALKEQFNADLRAAINHYVTMK